MSKTQRFTPASMDAFKRTARDVQRVYPLSLQQAQEILAKSYGYANLHALQEHMKTNPPVGPFHYTVPADSYFLLAVKVESRFSRLAPTPLGRLDFSHLCLLGTPEERQSAMDYEALVDGYISTKARAERTASVLDYVFFDDESCSFELTTKGKAMRDALRWVGHEYEFTEPGSKERIRIIKAMDSRRDRYPHNPLVAQYWFHWDIKDMHNQRLDGLLPDGELVRENWKQANKLRSIYDAVAPKDKLLSMRYDRDQSNFVMSAYMDFIYAGAYCAAVLGLEKELESWIEYGRRLDPKDVHGFRLLRLNTGS